MQMIKDQLLDTFFYLLDFNTESDMHDFWSYFFFFFNRNLIRNAYKIICNGIAVAL